MTSACLKKTGLFIGFALMLCLAGCEKSPSATGRKIEFEIDKTYQRGPLTVHVRLDKTELTIAQTLWLEFAAAIEPAYKVKMPAVNELLDDFGIVDWQDLGARLNDDNSVVSTYRYRLEPFLSGDIQIPAFVFEFADVNGPENKTYELTTEPIDIKVTSLLEDSRAELVIADIEQVVPMPREATVVWLWVFVSILVAGAVVVFLLRRKRRVELIRIFKPAHEIACERLRALVREDLIKAGRIKEFYERISDILRHYIEHRFDLRAPEMTTEEFLFALKDADVLSASDKEDLGRFLEHCDLVKFAEYEPMSEQIQQMFDLVRDFIARTESDEQKIDVTDTAAIEQTVEAGSA